MIFDPILDIFRGKAITIPPLDGAFRPNSRLDEADVVVGLPSVDNLAFRGSILVGSSGPGLYEVRLGDAQPVLLQSFDSPITALAVSAAGTFAVGLESGKLRLGEVDIKLPAEVGCITALAFDRDNSLWLANGAVGLRPSQWTADLMAKGASGSIWKLESGGEAIFEKVVGNLAFPYGLLPQPDGVAVTESWKHRILRLTPAGRPKVVLDHLPCYPARLMPSSDGGAWLSMFAPRNRLIEFVLAETDYRRDMIQHVPSEFWIAPALSSGRSFLEPLQCGGIKTMGVHKPWSPSRSYGLVAKLDANLQPLASFHSRANGLRHGTTSGAEVDGKLFVASKGGDCIVAIDVAEIH